MNADAWRGLGDDEVAVTQERHFRTSGTYWSLYIEALGNGQLRVILPSIDHGIERITLSRPETTDGPPVRTVAFERRGNDEFVLDADKTDAFINEGALVYMKVKGDEDRTIYTSAYDNPEIDSDREIYLSNFMKQRQWALAPKP